MTDFKCYRIRLSIDSKEYSNFLLLGNGDGTEPEIDWTRLIMPSLFGLVKMDCVPGFWDGKEFSPYKEEKQS